MERALLAISILLAAAVAAAAEPQTAAPSPSMAPSAEAPAAAYPLVPAQPSTAAANDAGVSIGAAEDTASSQNPPSAPAAENPTTDGAGSLLAADSAVPAPAAEQGRDAEPPAAPVPTVDVNKVTDDTVCRKERPTGSLIGVTRCHSRSAAANDDKELMKRDLEEMRMRQNDQLAREAAAAMSRRRGGL